MQTQRRRTARCGPATSWLSPVLGLVLLAACSTPSASPTGAGAPSSAAGAPGERATRDQLIVRLWDNPQGFDPATLFRVETENVAFNIYNALTTYEPNTGEIVPDLAERWETMDATTWTFSLRKGVQWQGSYGELTSKDVLYSFNRILDPATGSPYRGEFGNVEELSAPDDYTIVAKLKSPDANFLHQVASYHQGQIVKKDAVEKFGDQYQMNPIGTGAYMLEKFAPNSEIVLTRFDGYYKGPARIKTIIYRIIKEDSTAEVALKNREVDIAGRVSDNSALDHLVKDSRLVNYRNEGYGVNLTVFNLTFEPFSKLAVRQAYAHAIDREAIVQATAPLTQKAAYNIIPTFMSVYNRNVPQYPFDPARSRALLAEAGYPDGISFKVTGLAAGGVSDADLLRQDYLAKVGIKIDFELIETAVYNQRRNSGDFIMSGRLLPAVNPDTILFGYLHPSNIAPKGLNGARYSNPALTDLLEQARAETNDARRNELYADVQRIAMTDLPYFPMAESGTNWPAWPGVKGIVINKLANVEFWPVTVDPI